MTYLVFFIYASLVADALTSNDINVCESSLDELEDEHGFSSKASAEGKASELVLLQLRTEFEDLSTKDVAQQGARVQPAHYIIGETVRSRVDLLGPLSRGDVGVVLGIDGDGGDKVQVHWSKGNVFLTMNAAQIEKVANSEWEDGMTLARAPQVETVQAPRVETVNTVELASINTNPVGGVGTAAAAVGEAFANDAAGAAASMQKLNSRMSDKPLGGNSKDKINWTLLSILLLVAGVIGGVWALENLLGCACCCCRVWPEGRPKPWVLTMLICAYVLLIPALFEVLFSFEIIANFMGMTIMVTSEPDGSPGPLTESAWRVINLLWDTGSATGACVVTLFCIVVPILKLILLTLGEAFRTSSPTRSRSCILFVQCISKWACPDMFAYILLTYLVRHLGDHTDGLIESPAKLDIGFSCFVIFCVLSTLSSLAVEAPEADSSSESMKLASLGAFPTEIMFAFMITLCAVFGMFFCYGIDTPCMGLSLTEEKFLEPNGPIPRLFKPVLDQLHVSEIVSSKVTIWSCVTAMYDWAISSGEWNDLLALTMLFGFAVVLPCCSMVCLAVAARQLEKGESRAWSVAHVLGHVAMLDVLCMGVFVITVSAPMSDQGVDIHLEPGILLLLGAEVTHYVAYMFIRGAAQSWELKRKNEEETEKQAHQALAESSSTRRCTIS
jgi:uncharacterized paraquat-inducible protein A